MHHAAWSPVTDPYEVGDYGAFRRGIFQKLGNIRELGVEAQTRWSFDAVSIDDWRSAEGAPGSGGD